jgi:very-short-patch-repair endonuclease
VVFKNKYIADFAHKYLKVIIEVDGSSHEGKEAYDAKREAELLAMQTNIKGLKNWTVLRFTNDEVINNPNQVVSAIKQHLLAKLPANPPCNSPAWLRIYQAINTHKVLR